MFRTNGFKFHQHLVVIDYIPSNLSVRLELTLGNWDNVEKLCNIFSGKTVDLRHGDWKCPGLNAIDKSLIAYDQGQPIFVPGDFIMTPDYKVYKVIKVSRYPVAI